MPRRTGTFSLGTSLNFTVLFSPLKIASETSLPTLRMSMSKAAEISMSEMWYPPRYVHETGHGVVRIRVLVVLESLDERRGAVPHADDRDSDFLAHDAPSCTGVGEVISALTPAEEMSRAKLLK